MRQKLYPYLKENVVGGGVEAGALIWFFAAIAAIIFQCYLFWRPLTFYLGLDERSIAIATEQAQATHVVSVSINPLQVVGGVEIDDYITPTQELTATQIYIVMVTPTPEIVEYPIGEETGRAVVDLPAGYRKVLVVGRFSNYWPANGGINAQGDAELFADGSRVDQAIVEGQGVVACPPELLLGTRLEYPPGSGLVWTCRDRGGAITFYYGESGLPIYWFDFLSPVAFVDYGSYIQVEMYVPCSQTECNQ